uniref:Tigger transposable element-derived protein 6 n=1 Tax=Sipha flava TaxID=143950 RepID=A0A2S2QB75_9HEMI
MASKRKHLTLTEKIKLLDFYQKENVSARTLADKFGIGRTQATDLIKNRETILKLWKSHGNDQMKTTKRRKTESGNINEVVYEWFCAARAKNIPISGPILKEKALQVSKEFKCENFKASNGWLDKFKSCYNISFKVVCGESKSVDTETVDEWRIKVKQLISSYEPRNIYNADETGLFYKILPNKTLSFKNEICTSGIKYKRLLTVMLCINFIGEFEKSLNIR